MIRVNIVILTGPGRNESVQLRQDFVVAKRKGTSTGFIETFEPIASQALVQSVETVDQAADGALAVKVTTRNGVDWFLVGSRNFASALAARQVGPFFTDAKLATVRVRNGNLGLLMFSGGSTLAFADGGITAEYASDPAKPFHTFAPVLQAIADTRVDEGQPFTLTTLASDADQPAQQLTFTLEPGAPSGASIDPATGVLTWTPSEAEGPGTYPITVVVTDNGSPPLSHSKTFQLAVNEVNSASVLEPIGNKSVNEGSALNFVVAAADPNDIPPNKLVLSVTGFPPGASFDEAAGAFAWTPGEVQGPGTYPVTFTVTDDGTPPLSASETITITVNEANRPPSLDPITDSVIDEGTQLQFTASATDSDIPANTLTFSLGPGAPDGASIDMASGAFVWTPSEAQGPGSYPITVVVTDNGTPAETDSRTFTVTVNELNSAPALAPIGNKNVNEGSALNFGITASDPNDIPPNKLTLSVAGLPAGATFDAATGAFAWTPDEIQGPGAYQVTFTVTDDGQPPLSASETITITVNEVNRPPSLDPISDSVIDEGTQLQFTASATDPDLPANLLTFSLGPGAPDGASLDGVTGTFVWTPNEARAPGTYSITVVVTDNGTPPLSDAKTFTVTVNEVNSAPVLASIGNKTVDELSELTFAAAASDPNDTPPNKVTLSASGLPEGARFDAASGVFSWTPTEAQGPGTYSLTFTATDGGVPPLNASETVTITVKEVNRPPVLAAIGNKTVEELSELTFAATASDPNDTPPNKVTLSASGLPEGARFDAVSGVFSWTPTEEQGPGGYTITITATDDGVPPSTASETITITVKELNQAPRLEALGERSVEELSELTFAATATDADVPANKITLSATGLPEGAMFHAVTDTFRWTPSEEQGPGSYVVTFTATDDGVPPLTSSETLTITVHEINAAPVLAAIGDKAVDELSELTFAATAADPNDIPPNKVTLSASGLPDGASLDPATGRFSWAPSEVQGPSSYAVTFTATDNGSPPLSDSKTVTVTVNEVNSAPKLSVVSDQLSEELSELTFAATATDADVPANKVTLSASGLPEGAMFDAVSGVFSWAPTESQGPGSYIVTLKATDDGLPPLSDSQTVTITVKEVNAPPVLASIGNQIVDEHQSLAFTVAGSDTNDRPANNITLNASGLPNGAAFDPVSGAFAWTPGEEQQGEHTVTFTATDDGTPPLSVSEAITIRVRELNNPPVAYAQALTTDEDAPVAITLSGADPENQALMFSVVEPPGHGSLSGEPPNLNYTPAPDFNGADRFTFKGSDGQSESGAATVAITVKPVNDAPVVSLVSPPAGGQFIAPATIGLEADASDVEGGITLVEFFAGATKLGEKGDAPYRVTWPDVPAGHFSVSARATDDQGASTSSAAMELTVLASLRSVEVLPDGSFRLTLHGEPGRQYALESSDDLRRWTAVRTETVAANGALPFTEALPPSLTQRFYRARLLPTP